MSTGAKVAVFGGIAGVVLVVLLVVLVVSYARRKAPVSQPGSYAVNLAQNGGQNTRKVHLVGGSRVTIRVRNHVNTDVDLYVIDSSGEQIAADDGPETDCIVTFDVRHTGMYDIEVVNVGPAPTLVTVEYH